MASTLCTLPPEIHLEIMSHLSREERDAYRVRLREAGVTRETMNRADYLNMMAQPEGSVYRVALREIENGRRYSFNLQHREKPPQGLCNGQKAVFANRVVNHSIQENLGALRQDDLEDLGIDSDTAIAPLSMPQKTLVGERIHLRRAEILNDFFDRLADSLPEARSFLMTLPPVLSPRARAGEIRNWMNNNKQLLSKGGQLYIDLPFNLLLPPETACIYPRLSDQHKSNVRGRMSRENNSELFRRLLNEFKNDPALGPQIIYQCFSLVTLFGNPKWINEIGPHFLNLPSQIPIDTDDGVVHVDVIPSLIPICGVSSIPFLQAHPATIQIKAEDFLTLLMGAIDDSVINALRDWPQAKEISAKEICSALQLELNKQIRSPTDAYLSLLEWPQAKQIEINDYVNLLKIATHSYNSKLLRNLLELPQAKHIEMKDYVALLKSTVWWYYKVDTVLSLPQAEELFPKNKDLTNLNHQEIASALKDWEMRQSTERRKEPVKVLQQAPNVLISPQETSYEQIPGHTETNTVAAHEQSYGEEIGELVPSIPDRQMAFYRNAACALVLTIASSFLFQMESYSL